MTVFGRLTGLLALASLTLFIACGYKLAGRGERLPPDIKTIAIPIFVNQSSAFSDYHVTGGNACLTDAAFVANRFRVAPVRRMAA